jgi:hypothetical protein
MDVNRQMGDMMPNSIWSHLPSSAREPKARAQPNSLKDAMWPNLSERAKAQDLLREQRKQNLLQGLRELNSKLARKR